MAARVAAVALISAPLLAACGGTGFRPMYAASSGSQLLSDKMAQVAVTTIPGRVGQQVRNELIFETTGGGQAAVEKRYQLSVTLRERVTSSLVNIEGDSEAQIYHIDGTFELIDLQNKETVLQGQSFSRASFQRFQSIYANVRAKKNAEDRAAKTLATDLRSRIEAYLAGTG